MNSLTPKTTDNGSGAEATSLAHKLANARRELVEEFERYHAFLESKRFPGSVN